MRTLKQILGEKLFKHCFAYSDSDDWGDWGLGTMHKDERQKLLKIGAIKTVEGQDVVACDAFCVNTYRNGEATCVYEGDKFSCEMEAERVKRERPSLKVKVMSYPKLYFEHCEMQSKQQKAREFESESLNALANEFQGEVMPSF